MIDWLVWEENQWNVPSLITPEREREREKKSNQSIGQSTEPKFIPISLTSSSWTSWTSEGQEKIFDSKSNQIKKILNGTKNRKIIPWTNSQTHTHTQNPES